MLQQSALSSSSLSLDDEEPEFYPPSVLVLLIIIFLVLHQLSKSNRSNNVITSTRATQSQASPLSLVSLTTGYESLIKAIQTCPKPSLTSQTIVSLYLISFFSFVVLPKLTSRDLTGSAGYSPTQAGLQYSDIYEFTTTTISLPYLLASSSSTSFSLYRYLKNIYNFIFSIPSLFSLYTSPKPLSFLTRLFSHIFFVCDSRVPLLSSSSIYWVVVIPGFFYVIFALLDGNYTTSPTNNRYLGSQGHIQTSRTSTSYSLFGFNVPFTTKLFNNFFILLFGEYFCVATSLQLCNIFNGFKFGGINVFQLYDNDVYIGAESLLTALTVLLFYRNPIIYIDLLSPGHRLSSPAVESRWVISSLLFLLYCCLPWRVIPTLLIGGLLSGMMLAAREWVMDGGWWKEGGGERRKEATRFRLQLFLEMFIYISSSLFLPFCMSQLPPFEELNIIISSRGLKSAALWLSSFSGYPPLWLLLCISDRTSRMICKMGIAGSILLVGTPFRAIGTASRALGVVHLIELFYIMNTPFWSLNPHAGFLVHLVYIYRLLISIPNSAEYICTKQNNAGSRLH